MNYSGVSSVIFKPNTLCVRLLPMRFLLILFIGYFAQLPGLKSQKIAEPIVSIVNTKELLSLINTSDDTLRLFNFWATWCQPCVRELPFFEELNTLKKEEKFHLYLVSLDFPNSIKKKLIPFLKKKNIQSNVLLFDGGNPNDWIDKINEEWSGAIPASLVAYKGKTCFEENSFDSLNSLSIFINHCKTNLKL